jgi:hypothetical protein
MEIELKTSALIATLKIKSGNAKIEEDLAEIENGVMVIPKNEVMNFITIAREMNYYNGKSDIDFVKMIYEALLNDSAKECFLYAVTHGLKPNQDMT